MAEYQFRHDLYTQLINIFFGSYIWNLLSKLFYYCLQKLLPCNFYSLEHGKRS